MWVCVRMWGGGGEGEKEWSSGSLSSCIRPFLSLAPALAPRDTPPAPPPPPRPKTTAPSP